MKLILIKIKKRYKDAQHCTHGTNTILNVKTELKLAKCTGEIVSNLNPSKNDV